MPQNHKVRKVVVFQMSGVGDLLLTTPALRALSRLYPRAKMDIITYNIKNAEFLFRLPYVNANGLVFPLFDLELKQVLFPAFWRKLLNPICQLRKNNYDIYISFHHTWLLQWYLFELLLAICSGAKFRVGINPGFVPHHGVFDRSVSESELGALHYRHFFLDVVALLGPRTDDYKTEFVLKPKEIVEARQNIAKTMHGRKKRICFHVGASHPSQLWPIDRFRELAERLVARGYGIVLVGNQRERDLNEQVTANLPDDSFVNAAGDTDLFQMAALIDSTDLFIGNDSGPMHVSIARKRPTIGLIGPGKPRYHNYSPEEALMLKSIAANLDYDPIELKLKPWPWEITVDQVFNCALRMLS